MSESNIEIKIEPAEVKEEPKEPEELSNVYVENSIWLDDVKAKLPRVEAEFDCNTSDYLHNENIECETEIKPDIKVKQEFAPIEFISFPNIQFESNDYSNCNVKEENTELELKQKCTFLKCAVNLERYEYSNVTYFVCEYCQKFFRRETNLQDHLITHQKISLTEIDYINEPLKCDKCEYITSEKDIMDTHMMLHNIGNVGNDPEYYVCKVCNYRTLKIKTLISHQCVHTDNSPFKCNICGHVALDKSRLCSHMTKKSQKRYVCNVCNFKTVRKSSLTKHLRKHTDKSPFKCDMCAYSTGFKHNLTLHKRIHTGERPYKCNQCEYSSTQKSALNVHVKTHAVGIWYGCDMCSYKTKRKDYLKLHKNKMH